MYVIGWIPKDVVESEEVIGEFVIELWVVVSGGGHHSFDLLEIWLII